MNKAVLFDRDGVLNKLVYRNNGFYSPRKVSQFSIFSGSKELTEYTRNEGYLNIIVSNQPDISRGLMSIENLNEMSNKLYDSLFIDDILYCMHDDGECNCRKPLNGLIIEAKKKWNIDLSKSFLIGDTLKDLGAAEKSGLDFILISSDYNKEIICKKKVKKITQVEFFLK